MADGFEYGFIADGRLHTKAFGIVPFTSPEMAEHTGSKWWTESLVIVRRHPDGDWEPVPDWPVREWSP